MRITVNVIRIKFVYSRSARTRRSVLLYSGTSRQIDRQTDRLTEGQTVVVTDRQIAGRRTLGHRAVL